MHAPHRPRDGSAQTTYKAPTLHHILNKQKPSPTLPANTTHHTSLLSKTVPGHGVTQPCCFGALYWPCTHCRVTTPMQQPMGTSIRSRACNGMHTVMQGLPQHRAAAALTAHMHTHCHQRRDLHTLTTPLQLTRTDHTYQPLELQGRLRPLSTPARLPLLPAR